MRVVSGLLLLLLMKSINALNLRCQYYTWDSTEVKYVCKGDENAVTWSGDSATTPNLMYLGEFRTNLGVCQGRCRSDSDCQDGLVCIFRDPTVAVIDDHCANGHVHRFVNYCYYNDEEVQEDFVEQAQAEVPVDQLVYKGEPPFTSKLKECEGDCDTDWNCGFGLNCYKRSDDREIPGCEGIGIYSVDYCYVPPPDTLVLVMDAAATVAPSRAGKCEGSCIDDDDCLTGLACFRRTRYEYVPGCRGLGAYATNYCFDPNDIVVPTAMPQLSPTATPTAFPTDISQKVVVDTEIPTEIPSEAPSMMFSSLPSADLTSMPSVAASSAPSGSPSTMPTVSASVNPSNVPSSIPTVLHSQSPSDSPSSSPTTTLSESPSDLPSTSPSETLSASPTETLSTSPSETLSASPSATPSIQLLIPSSLPSDFPSIAPSATPVSPTSAPTLLSDKALPAPGTTQSPVVDLPATDRPTSISQSVVGGDDTVSTSPSDSVGPPSANVAPSPDIVSGVSDRPSSTPTNVVSGVDSGSASPSDSLVPPLEVEPSASMAPSPDTSSTVTPTTIDSTSKAPSIDTSITASDWPSSYPTKAPSTDTTISVPDIPSSSPSALSSDWPSMVPSVTTDEITSPVSSVTSDAPVAAPTSEKITSRPTMASASVIGGGGPGQSNTASPAVSPVLAAPFPILAPDNGAGKTLGPTGIPTNTVVGGSKSLSPTSQLTPSGPINEPTTAAPTSSPVNEPTAIAPIASPVAETAVPTTVSESVNGGDRDQSSPTAMPTTAGGLGEFLPSAAPTEGVDEDAITSRPTPTQGDTSPSNTALPTALSCNPDPNLRAKSILLELAESGFDMELRESTMAFYWLISEAVGCPETRNIGQRFTMATLYYSLSGWNCTETNVACFLSSVHECAWAGVTCNSFGEVSNLRLDDLGLKGSLPNLSRLTSLVELDMDSNMLSGSIPSWIGDLKALEILDFDSNMITGSIPTEIGNASLLRVIDLDGNKLLGSIPDELGSLESLYFLQLDFNQLTGGLPSSIAGAPSLEYLSLIGNNFTEPLSIDFCDRQLDLYANCEMCSIAECCTACLTFA